MSTREDREESMAGGKRSSPLYAIMLKLRPRTAGDILPNAGQLAHAALLAWLHDVDPALSARLHEPNNDRPFTCSSLWFPDERAVALAQRENRRLPILPPHTYWLRLTLLTDELFRTLTARFLRPALVTAATAATARATGDGGLGLPALRLGSVQFDVAELLAVPDVPDASGMAGTAGMGLPTSWAGYDTYEGLVARARALDVAAAGSRTLTLEFRSPTAFSDGQQAWGKRMHLFPDADRVFDRLARVWNAWAPAEMALDVHALQEHTRAWVAIAQHTLQTRTLHFDRHTQVGFVGRCTYELMDVGLNHKASRRPPHDTTSAARATESEQAPIQPTIGAGLTPPQALHLLAWFAFYAGVGQKTTMGMGQARPLPQRAVSAATQAIPAIPATPAIPAIRQHLQEGTDDVSPVRQARTLKRQER